MAGSKSPFEDREVKRSTVILAGQLIYAGQTIACRVRDVSVGGCRIECAERFAVGTPLHIELSRYGRFPAVVAWVDGGEMGLAFPDGAAAALARFGEGAEKLGIVAPAPAAEPGKILPFRPRSAPADGDGPAEG
ncbi:MAG: PilZ domain-containing protein [Alphaproteobacteria bacterium]|nr:PilZ domain-containing protein [Alphaproteobacteria bacterium]